MSRYLMIFVFGCCSNLLYSFIEALWYRGWQLPVKSQKLNKHHLRRKNIGEQMRKASVRDYCMCRVQSKMCPFSAFVFSVYSFRDVSASSTAFSDV